jgi:heme-degrading monooxygenase HmoA
MGERAMYVTIVTYKPTNGKSAAEVVESFDASTPLFRSIPGLIRKYFCFDDDAHEGTSVYVWQDRKSAEACFGNPEFLGRFKKSFGCDPTIKYVETKLVVDNAAKSQ